MSFDYDKLRSRDEDPNWWTAYADLWAMLAIVFLMMFVATSLRTGAQGVQQQIEYGEAQKKNAELQEQLRVYSNLRDETLQASGKQEQEVYKKLMSQLSLLQDQAHEEKEDLRKQAQENENKEFALNEYQQIVRNIIDSNILSKSQIKRRDQLIVAKKQTIEELNQEVNEREKTITQNETEIQTINNQLSTQIHKLENEQKKAKLSKQAMNKAVERLKNESQKKVAALKAENQQASDELQQELENTKASYVSQMNNLKAENAAKLAGEKAAFEKSLAQQQLGAEERAGRLAAFQRAAEAKAKGLEGELAGLAGKIRDTEAQLGSAKSQLGSTQAQLGAAREAEGKLVAQTRSLAQEKQVLTGDLARAQELINAKKNLIAQMQKNFDKAGIKAQVNGKSGDVTIDFGEEYFDTGSAELKPGMTKALTKFVPTYSQSLFQDAKSAQNISSIEIIGFASSTYKGKYVNPRSLKPENQEAINYNLKLSFARANAIFKFIFNPDKLSFATQKRLLPLVKVVGRGFLPEGTNEKELPEDMPESEFCAKYNCKKAQRVIVKFNLKD